MTWLTWLTVLLSFSSRWFNTPFLLLCASGNRVLSMWVRAVCLLSATSTTPTTAEGGGRGAHAATAANHRAALTHRRPCVLMRDLPPLLPQQIFARVRPLATARKSMTSIWEEKKNYKKMRDEMSGLQRGTGNRHHKHTFT